MITQTVLLDTALGSKNLGDKIIVDAVCRELSLDRGVQRLPTHSFLSVSQLGVARSAKTAILAGTNVLFSRYWRPMPWKLGPLEAAALSRSVVPVGVGWRRSERPPSGAARVVLRSLFPAGVPVSARDQRTEQSLLSIGVPALYTGCATMWCLQDSQPVADFAVTTEVVTTVTDYSKDPFLDGLMIDRLLSGFSRVLLWPQGSGDVDYARFLARDRPRLEILKGNLGAFEEALAGRVYVGTRLHAGIRAMQRGVPALVVVVDNRAREIGRDTGLRTVERRDVGRLLLDSVSEMGSSAPLVLPLESIERWRNSVVRLMESD